MLKLDPFGLAKWKVDEPKPHTFVFVSNFLNIPTISFLRDSKYSIEVYMGYIP